MTVVASPAADRTTRRGTRGRWALFFGTAAIVAIADQISKAWVAANFQPTSVHAPAGPGGPTQVIGDWVRIAVSHNDGGIFGLVGSSAVVLGFASLIVIAFIVYYEARQGVASHWIWSLTLGLLLGGAIGNLIDRFRYGYVVDWVDMGIGDTRWYTFNVADAAVSTALVLFVVLALFGDRLTGSAQVTEGEGDTTGTTASPTAGVEAGNAAERLD